MSSTNKERPILFSGPMVRALLDGRKTVTRRLLKHDGAKGIATPDPQWEQTGDHDTWIGCDDAGTTIFARHRYGQPGDRLWVKETWALEDLEGDGQRVVWQADRAAAWRANLASRFYLASDYAPPRWRPSIHMTRWASRLTLQVVSVRAERLHDITEEDARAEGVNPVEDPFQGGAEYWECYEPKCVRDGGCAGVLSARKSFQTLWASINGAESWEANPWVWRIQFSRVSP